MRLINLQLDNFQGIKQLTIDFEGYSASIYGDNATGKTTVFNAVTWLLFDKPSTGAKNFTPKTKGPDGDMHFLDHAATGQFQMDDGRIITLRKVFHEIWKKKKGSATEEFSGHTIDFYIDGVPVKEKDYTAALLTLCGGIEQMKMLTMPHYFAEGMDWNDRRKILLDICGDITDMEVIASKKELRELPSFLLMPGTTDQHYTVDEFKKIAGAQKTDINKQLQGIPGRVDEAQRAMPEKNFDLAAVDAELARLSVERERLAEEKACILAGDTAAADVRKRISDANAELAEARAAYIAAGAAANEGTHGAIAEIRRQLGDAKSAAAEAEQEAQRRQRNIERMTVRRDELLKEYEAVKNEVWDTSEAVCPTCKRELPAEQVEGMRDEFNIRKSNRLQRINEQGQTEASKESIEEEKGAYAREIAKKESAIMRIPDLEQQLEELQDQLKQQEPFEATEKYAALTAKIAELRLEESGAGNSTSTATAAINEQIQAIREKTEVLQRQKTQAAQADTQRKRIEELKSQEKMLSTQYEELEKGIYLCELFTKAKVGMLTDRINGKFKSVSFRLFIEQQNGGVKDDCEVMIPTDSGNLIPFAFANNAARINAGLEIIGALSEHWGLSMPVFIDNAEGVTRLAQMETQVVRLVVSEADKALRLELNARNDADVA